MLYRPNTSADGPEMIAGEAHPEDTARAVDAIRDLICREEGVEAHTAPRPTQPRTAQAHAGQAIPAPLPEPHQAVSGTDTAAPAAASRPSRAARKVTMPAALKRFEPSWKLSGLLFLAAVVIWRPWLIPALLLLSVALAAILWLSLGPDRAGALIARWHARMAQHNPERAESLRIRAARLSARAERLASRLPERWTRGLYFPDFEPAPDPEEANPFERLVPQHRL